jgi:hypothetical protein
VKSHRCYEITSQVGRLGKTTYAMDFGEAMEEFAQSLETDEDARIAQVVDGDDLHLRLDVTDAVRSLTA